jgi:tRNA(Arg) A34 adenosine deaminase TadA
MPAHRVRWLRWRALLAPALVDAHQGGSMLTESFEVTLPDWARQEAPRPEAGRDAESRMALALRLAERNVAEATGGPFGAAVFDLASGALLGMGVNRVVASGLSLAHAEVLALANAQRAIGSFDLAADGRRCVLVTSAEPCAMCLGATCWSGVVAVECGARGEDVETIGFDEGPKPEDWVAALEARGISVQRDVLRAQVRSVLDAYANQAGEIYNPSR